MIRWIVLLFIIVHTLYAIGDKETLKRADALMHKSSKSDKFRAYNEYKNLYLKAMISQNNSLMINSLKGIVKSGKSLHIDVSDYNHELVKLNSHKKHVNIDTKLKVKSKKNKKIKIKKLHKLKSIKVVDNDLILKFDSKLKSNQIKYFTLYDSVKRRYRYVHQYFTRKSNE